MRVRRVSLVGVLVWKQSMEEELVVATSSRTQRARDL